MAQVVLDRVCKSYPGNVVAVEDFSLTVSDRELVVIVGPSGCGKTTILRLTAGLELSTRGTILIGGQKVNDWPPQDRNVAMVFQNYALYPQLTVFENLAFGIRLRGRESTLTSEELESRIRDTAELLRLGHLLERMPRELSGGERQRVAIGKAIVRRPKVFLFDEPLTGLDQPLRLELRREIAEMHRLIEAPMLYVTHDQEEALSLGDRIVVMNRGVVQQIGTREDLNDRPQSVFVARFIPGVPAPMNVINGRLVAQQEVVGFEFNGGFWKLPRVHGDVCRKFLGKEVSLGVRPNAIRFAAAAELASEWQRVTAKVESIERVANGCLLHMNAGTASFVCQVSDEVHVEREATVELVVDMMSSHWFDSTGTRIPDMTEKRAPGG